MAGTNQFYPVATGVGANVLTPGSWQASSVRQSGFGSGIAPSNGFNTAWRQSSSVSAMIGAFIAAQGYDALDNGDIATLGQNYLAALGNVVSGAYPSTSLVHAGADTSSTANTITIPVVSPDVSGLADYQVFEIVPAVTITGPTNIQIKNYPAIPLLRRDGQTLKAGDGPANSPFLVVKYGAAFRRLDAAPSEVAANITTYFNTLSITGGRVTVFATPGPLSWTAPTGAVNARIVVLGGGGGGGGASGSAGAGGAGGGYDEKTFAVTAGQVYSGVVGAGGSPGQSNGTAATSGGTSSFTNGSATVSATGGTFGGFGNGGTTGLAGNPGAGVGGDYQLAGSGAQDGFFLTISGTNYYFGGIGGGSRFAPSTPFPAGNGRFDGSGYGGGGSGAAGTGNGGAGRPGIVIITA